MMSRGEQYFKWGVILVGIIVVWSLARGCNCGGTKTITKTDTISVRHDTIIHKIDTFVSYVPKPYKIVRHDTLEIETEIPHAEYDSLPAKVKQDLSDYYSKVFYKDTIPVKYGQLYTFDTVRYNRITGKGFGLDQSIPEITNTVTLQAPKRVTGYIGFTEIGSPTTPFYQIGASFYLQGKNQRIFGSGALIDKDGKLYWNAQYILKLSLHKN